MFQVLVLALEIVDLVGIGFPGGITCESRKREHIDFIAYSWRIAEPAIHDLVDTINTAVDEYIRALAVYVGGGEYRTAAPVVPVQEIGAKATYPPGRSSALVCHFEAVVGLVRYGFLCSAPYER